MLAEEIGKETILWQVSQSRPLTEQGFNGSFWEDSGNLFVSRETIKTTGKSDNLFPPQLLQ